MTLLPTSVVLKKFLLWMDSPLHVLERSCCAAEHWVHDDDDGDDDDGAGAARRSGRQGK